jgi:glutamine synthetase
MKSLAEYIWLDGNQPTQELRSKTRVVELQDKPKVSDLPWWSFDGSSTNQAQGHDSDLTLKPVRVVNDPIRKGSNILVLCEVFESDDKAHGSNTRASLRKTLERVEKGLEPQVGFEQEYTLFKGEEALAWSEGGTPQDQGPFYCGNGADRVFGRKLSESHISACLEANLQIFGANAEVMPGQWEVQIGYRGLKGDENDVLCASDHLLLARWILIRLAEKEGITISFANKPVKGNWNGAGCHTNISTKQSRDPASGIKEIETYIDTLSKEHSKHIRFYGHALDERLTGKHETCSIKEFRSGVGDRGASVRIPKRVKEKGFGYFEDRRPGANVDPYIILDQILSSLYERASV